jgi:hypothetical protein
MSRPASLRRHSALLNACSFFLYISHNCNYVILLYIIIMLLLSLLYILLPDTRLNKNLGVTPCNLSYNIIYYYITIEDYYSNDNT